MLFCRCREGVRVELALRLATGIHSYGPYDVKIGLILPRLFISDRGLRSATLRCGYHSHRFRSGPPIRSLLEAAETTLSNAQV